MNVINIKGRPKFTSGQFLGYVLWKQSDGFHLRWTTEGNKASNFQGKVTSQTKLKIVKRVRLENEDNINATEKNTIEWNTKVKNQIDGVDFLTPGDFTVELRINKKKINPKNIFLGAQMIQPEKNPFTITQITVKKKIERKKRKESIYEPTPEPEPVYEPTPELEPEPIYEPTPEPEPEDKPKDDESKGEETDKIESLED